MLNYIAHSHPNITSLLYTTTKNINPTEEDFKELLLLGDYIWQTGEKGLILHPAQGENEQL
jgi:hypothetical protein